MGRACFIEQERTLASEGDDDVARTHLLELAGVLLDVGGGLDLRVEDLGELQTVGLDQEGVLAQRVDQQLAGRVNGDHDLLILDALEHPLIDIVGTGLGDTARED